MRYILPCLFFVAACTTQKSVERNLAIAEAYQSVGEYGNAIEYYQKVNRRRDDKESKLNIAACYKAIHNYKQALKWLDLISLDQLSDSLIYEKCLMLKANGDYQKALDLYYVIDDMGIDTNFITSCDSSINWIKDPKYKSIKVRNLKELNSEYSDVCPMRYENGLVFSSTRDNIFGKKIQGKTKEPFFDLFKVRSRGNEWGKVVPFSSNINTGRHEGAFCFNPTSDTIYFTRSGDNKYVKESGENVVHLKLFLAYKDGFGWSKAKSFMLNDSIYSVGHPTMGPKGQLFIFASDMPGGYGGVDLYMCVRIGEKWTKPKNLGPQINTKSNELYPFLHASGQLFFSSNGHLTMGGYDIFTASLEQGVFQDVANLRYPINSSADDFSFITDESMQKAYFSSNRWGGFGKEDLYEVDIRQLFK